MTENRKGRTKETIMKPITKRPATRKPKSNKNNKLLDFMAQACHFAQDHIGCPDAWPGDPNDRENMLQVVSYQMACFLSQNTLYGDTGVEWDIVIDELVDNTQNDDGIMAKSVDEWKKILNDLAMNEFGGWK